jgi:hypothetical protein
LSSIGGQFSRLHGGIMPAARASMLDLARGPCISLSRQALASLLSGGIKPLACVLAMLAGMALFESLE